MLGDGVLESATQGHRPTPVCEGYGAYTITTPQDHRDEGRRLHKTQKTETRVGRQKPRATAVCY